MSILFLDIDGVLNNHQKHLNDYCGIDQHCMVTINNVIMTTGCYIILSSAWRYMYPTAMTLEGLNYMFKTHGLMGEIVGVTERDEFYPRREDQIMAAASKLKQKWAVVDDLPLQIENFVRTDGRIGIQHHEGEMLIKLLAC